MKLSPGQLDIIISTSCSDLRQLDEVGGNGAAASTGEKTDEVEKTASSGSRDSRLPQAAEIRTECLPKRCDGEWMGTATGPGFEFPSLLGERSQISTLGPMQAGVGASRHHSPDQSALIDLAKEHRVQGVTCAESAVLKQWASEVGLAVRGPEVHPSRPFGRFPHLHVGSVDHIPVNDYG